MLLFAHKLAEATGEYDVDAMLHKISYRQLVRWRLYDQVDPIGPIRIDQAAAIIAATTWNRHRGKNEKAAKFEDFMPQYKRHAAKPRRQTPEEQMAMARFCTMAVGGKIIEKKNA